MEKFVKNTSSFKKPTLPVVAAALALAAVIMVYIANNADKPGSVIPELFATEPVDSARVRAIVSDFSYDGILGIPADGIMAWQEEYADENTLIIDGEMGQNLIALSAAEKPVSASYVIYLDNGFLFDDGRREPYSSLSPRLLHSNDDSGDKIGIDLLAPFSPGKYIYAVTLEWSGGLKVVYGIKMVMTG
jgi:hypothetical protein